MAIADTIKNFENDIQDAYGMIEEKGGTIPEKKNTKNLADAISTISGGGSNDFNIELENVATSSAISANNASAGLWRSIKKIGEIKLGRYSRYSFYNCSNLIEIKKFNYYEDDYPYDLYQIFNGCTKIETIPEIECGQVYTITNAFMVCIELKNLGKLKDLGKAYSPDNAENYSAYTLDLSYCTKLTRGSLLDIIDGLYDIKSKGCKNQSLKLGNTNLLKLTLQEIDVATQKGWNVT